MYSKILLAVDAGGVAESVVPAVASLARRAGATVIAVNVRGLDSSAETTRAAGATVDAVVAELRDAGVAAQGQVRTAIGAPAREIVAAATEAGADLIAMGSRGRGDLTGLLLGSTSHQVASLTGIPILLTRPGGATGGDLELGSLGRPVSRILVPVDGSEESLASIEEAGRLALEHDADALVLHVLELLAAGEGSYVEPPESGRATAREAAARLEQMGVRTSAQITPNRLGVATSIATFAEGWGADLIVLGSRRHGDFGSLVLGSVTHALLTHTRRPILIAGRGKPVTPAVTGGSAR